MRSVLGASVVEFDEHGLWVWCIDMDHVSAHTGSMRQYGASLAIDVATGQSHRGSRQTGEIRKSRPARECECNRHAGME
ncbi:hypothetical protein DIE06_35670 [Burkholderia sp. Bp8998]|nr:hypothetical protein DIE06_35670 [Burkholderia sp. Bp8998]